MEMIQQCPGLVSRHISGHISPGKSRFHHVFTTFSPRFHHVFTTFSPRFHHVFTMFSPRFHHVFTTCSPRFHHVFTTFSPRVHHVFTTFSPRFTREISRFCHRCPCHPKEGDVAVSGSVPGGLRGCGAVGFMAPWQRFNRWKNHGKPVENSGKP